MMYLKNDRITVKIGTVTFRSHKQKLQKEFLLDPTAITGWTDGVTARRDSTPRLSRDGDFAEVATMSARVISLSGMAVASTRQQLQEMRDEFIGLLSGGNYAEISVESTTGVRYATVGLEGTPSWIQQIDTAASWKIDLYAPDPRIYSAPKVQTVGASTSTGGGLNFILKYPLVYQSANARISSVTIQNDGNVDAWPVFIVTGDYFSGFTITDNKQGKVVFTGPVTMQAPVEIDMGKGTAVQSGVDKSTLLSERKWISIPPKEILRPSFIPAQSGPGWCNIFTKDTWI